MADPAPQESQTPAAPIDLGPDPVSSRVPAEPVEEGEPAAAPPEPKTVPLEALHEERSRRRALERQITEMQSNYQTLDQRLAALQTAAQAPQRSLPDPKSDPIGFTVEALPMLSRQVGELQQGMSKQADEQNRAARANQFLARVASEHAAFVQRQPDTDQAVQFLRQRKTQEYVAVGMSETEAQARLQQDETALAMTAIHRGENPYEVAYRVAGTLGYKPANGKPGGPNDAERLRMQAEGRQAATPSGGSGPGGGKVTLETLLKMSGKEFSKVTEGDQWRRLMQGY